MSDFIELWVCLSDRRCVLSSAHAARSSWPARHIERAPPSLWGQALRILVHSASPAQRRELRRWLGWLRGARGPVRPPLDLDHRLAQALGQQLGPHGRLALGVRAGPSLCSRLPRQTEPSQRQLPRLHGARCAPDVHGAGSMAAPPPTQLRIRDACGQDMQLRVRLQTAQAGVVSVETSAHALALPLGAGPMSFTLWEAPWPHRP